MECEINEKLSATLCGVGESRLRTVLGCPVWAAFHVSQCASKLTAIHDVEIFGLFDGVGFVHLLLIKNLLSALHTNRNGT